MDFAEAKELCIRGEITTADGAFECGLSPEYFYAKIKRDAEAYILFLSNMVKRSKLVSKHPNVRKQMQKQEKREGEQGHASMKKYESKTLKENEAKARELGVSYGYYVAMMKGLGKIGDRG